MKKKLIEELEIERASFESNGFDTNEHDLAIKYLKIGQKPDNWESTELLEACINDYEQLCRDYIN